MTSLAEIDERFERFLTDLPFGSFKLSFERCPKGPNYC